MNKVVEGCRIGSCRRHKACMYHPCRSLAMHRSPTDTGEGEAYRMTADEHDAMDKALLDSVTVRGHIKRDQPTNTEQVERVAEALWQAEAMRVTGRERLEPWSEVDGTRQDQFRYSAQAAINSLQGGR